MKWLILLLLLVSGCANIENKEGISMKYKKNLTAEEHRVLIEKGTEPAFSGDYVDFDKEGNYVCAACGNRLFDSDSKFKSGTGWPSFREAINGSVEFVEDNSLGMKRTEVVCAKCGGHLGHVFEESYGKRYCINSIALDFVETATFGAGCFWGVQRELDSMDGVVDTTVGYMGGNVDNPAYKQVSSGKTGHAEVVQVMYDPQRVSYKELLEKFYEIHDPTQKNRQGFDIGTQYRSVIFYHTEEQKKLAEESKKGTHETEIVEAKEFWKAEDYHQDYYK